MAQISITKEIIVVETSWKFSYGLPEKKIGSSIKLQPWEVLKK